MRPTTCQPGPGPASAEDGDCNACCSVELTINEFFVTSSFLVVGRGGQIQDAESNLGSLEFRELEKWRE